MTPTPPEMPGQPGPEATAEQYVLDQVAKAKVSLNRTRVFSLVALCLFGVYMIFMTANLSGFLQPHSAAEMAGGLISQRVTDQGPEIAAQVKQQIPVVIAQIPDYVQQQLPNYRQSLEDRFETDLTDNLNASSTQIDKSMDDYLTAHKEEIKAALDDGQNGTVVHQLGNDVTKQFIDSLKTTEVNGESVQSKLDSSLSSLSAIQKKMDRLANASDLTPQEKKTRHALAIMSKTINHNVPKLPVATASAL